MMILGEIMSELNIRANEQVKRPNKMAKIHINSYAYIFGPITGDKVRLGDTELWIEVANTMTRFNLTNTLFNKTNLSKTKDNSNENYIFNDDIHSNTVAKYECVSA